MNPYAVGLDTTWNILLGIAIFGSIGNIIIGIRSMLLMPLLNNWINLFLGFLVIAMIVVSLFPLVFCTVNLLNQDLTTIEFWRLEFSTGVFAIRVSSIVLSFQMARSLYRFGIRKKELGNIRRTRGLPYEKNANFTIDLEPKEAKLWLIGDLALISYLQFVFYLSTVAALWFCAIEGNHSLATTIAGWCIFYIIDDWSIISDYTDHYQMPAISAHTYKIQFFNLALIVLIPIALFGSWSVPIAIALYLTMLLSGTIATLLPKRIELLLEQ